jgi:hypothetical protein
MSAKTNGGPAFPAQPIYQHPHGATGMSSQEGMTLRDWFAGQVINGIVGGSLGSKMAVYADEAARLAYSYADAMLEERSK